MDDILYHFILLTETFKESFQHQGGVYVTHSPLAYGFVQVLSNYIEQGMTISYMQFKRKMALYTTGCKDGGFPDYYAYLQITKISTKKVLLWKKYMVTKKTKFFLMALHLPLITFSDYSTCTQQSCSLNFSISSELKK